MAPWSKPTIKGASSVLLAALGCLCLSDARPGVAIRFEIDPHMFPVQWRSDEVRASAMPLDRSEVARSRSCAEVALALYPDGLLRQNLRAVYFTKELSFFGLQYGGTNSLDTIYLANRGAQVGFTDQYLKASLHHELSSILLRNYADRFDEQAWRAANRPGAQYRNGGVQSIADGSADTALRAQFHVDGFLSQYGTSSLEEDFNTYAESLFTGGPAFWTAVDRFPRVRTKTSLVIGFYSSLDAQFTEPFFRGLASK